MRIRKRSMLPFSLSSPPRMASDLFSPRGASVQKTAEEAGGEDERVVRGPGQGELRGEGGFDHRIDRGNACLPGRRSDNGPSRGSGFCDRAEEEVNRCCMLSVAPILAQVEAYRDADADADAEEEERCSAREKGRNSGRNGSTKPVGAETSTDGRWEEREKAIPLKKRKGSLEWGAGGTAAAADQKQKKAKTKTKRPTKRKGAQDDDDDDDEEEKRAGGGASVTEAGEAITSVGKKGRRGNNGGLMEGSRCSRINGRGWRCCQQTLVGYSLCEHHLGKGRLRSMNSFPSRVSGASRPVVDDIAGSIISDKSEAQTASSKSATKKKIGMVKARSISSLLGLSTAAILSTNSTTATTAAAAASTTASSASATATATSS